MTPNKQFRTNSISHVFLFIDTSAAVSVGAVIPNKQLTRSTIEAEVPLKWFLNYGVPKPEIIGMPFLFRKMAFCFLGPWDYSSGCILSFADVSGRVNHGAP
ncbi:MAG: hypothetical protein ABJ059_05940 [Hyphomicrobiales bacterium]